MGAHAPWAYGRHDDSRGDRGTLTRRKAPRSRQHAFPPQPRAGTTHALASPIDAALPLA